MLPWPTPIQDDTILTPLPYSPDVYLDGSIHSLPDISLRDLYEMPHSGLRPLGYTYGLMMAAVHLLQRAKTLRTDRLESQNTYRSLRNQQVPVTRCPRVENPAAYKEIMDAASHIHANIPSELRVDMFSPVPWDNADVPMVVCHFLYESRKWQNTDTAADLPDWRKTTAPRTRRRFIRS